MGNMELRIQVPGLSYFSIDLVLELLQHGVRRCFSAGLTVPWGSFTFVICRPYSQIVSLTMACEFVDVCGLLAVLFDT